MRVCVRVCVRCKRERERKYTVLSHGPQQAVASLIRQLSCVSASLSRMCYLGPSRQTELFLSRIYYDLSHLDLRNSHAFNFTFPIIFGRSKLEIQGCHGDSTLTVIQRPRETIFSIKIFDNVSGNLTPLSIVYHQ